MALPDFSSVEHYFRFIRDVFVVLGIPGLFGIGVYLYKARVNALKEQVETAKEQAKIAEALRYDNAWNVLEGQKKVYEAEAQLKEKSIEELRKVGVEKDAEIGSLTEEVKQLRNNIAALETSQQAVRTLTSEPGMIRGVLFSVMRDMMRQALGEDELKVLKEVLRLADDVDKIDRKFHGC